jgi:hypothetical protein
VIVLSKLRSLGNFHTTQIGKDINKRIEDTKESVDLAL